MSEQSDTNSTASINSDSDKSEDITTKTRIEVNYNRDDNYRVTNNFERPHIHHNIEMHHSPPTYPRVDEPLSDKQEYDEYFMSVNQHKKSLRYCNIYFSTTDHYLR